MGTAAPKRNLSLEFFFLLVFVLTVPFWLFGGKRLPLEVDLPASAFAAFVPMVAAAMLSWVRRGTAGLMGLFRRTLDFRKANAAWYLPALLLAPLLYLLAYAAMRLAGSPLPAPDLPWQQTPLFFIVYFLFGAGEELGWTGYATDPLQERWGALRAGLILGLVWMSWHLIGFVQTGHAAGWIFWQAVRGIAVRIITVWIYYKTGRSVLAAILFHTTDNLSWTLFPNYGSHYDPFVNGLFTWLAAVAVTVVWGVRTEKKG